MVLFDGDDPTLFRDARCELGGNAVDREGSNAPNFELIEELGNTELVQVLQDGAHADDDRAATPLEPAPRRESGYLGELRRRVQA